MDSYIKLKNYKVTVIYNKILINKNYHKKQYY